MKVKARRREKLLRHTPRDPKCNRFHARYFTVCESMKLKTQYIFRERPKHAAFTDEIQNLNEVEKIFFFEKKNPIHSCRVSEREREYTYNIIMYVPRNENNN